MPGTIPSADEIAEKASRGEDISAYFTNKFTVVRPVLEQALEQERGGKARLKRKAG
jgi:hypothetical protein